MYYLLPSIILVSITLIGAWFIRTAIIRFKEGKYFSFGLSCMVVAQSIISLAYLTFN